MNPENWSLAFLRVFQLLERKLESKVKMLQKRKNPKSKPYDKAYFFVSFVMLFYSFLAFTVFWGYSCSKKAISKKDLYQEFNEKKRWNKNVTRPWQRSITSKMKLFFEHWNKGTGLNACRRLLSWGVGRGGRYLIQPVPA